MSEKYEREIEEIIKKSGADLTPRMTLRQAFADLQRRTRVQTLRLLGVALRWITPAAIGLTGAALLIVGLVARHALVTILALALLLLAYLVSIVRNTESFRHATGYERTWRGRSLETRPPSGLRSALRRWFRRR